MKKPIIHKQDLRLRQNSLFIILFLMAFLERTIFDIGPNYELLTAAIILSSYFLNRKSAFLLTFLVIAFSDRLIGNSKIFLFTWSGLLLPAFFASPILKSLTTNYQLLSTKKLFTGLLLVISGLSTNLFFYLWTNLGVWLLDSWGMYSKDAAGLVRCYINALPFLKNQVVSSLVFIPLGYFAINYIQKFVKSMKFKYDISRQSFNNTTI